ncbi:hypothetical protein CC117_19505 [Parafrankia colletiae]|uniref:Uncharacterized protein n=1 Tax=Parafrankia colletiae TaxID=573497 RepID=A0A1S1QPC9_9ACTN|nr:hypothetical protein [Parafrankia colletiae]MCK9903067.1 hypothetical protein [Frankia sp. Cpl3]OHV35429.1 hypothetical protein CC117_19505 [Parafrankia colletiae]
MRTGDADRLAAFVQLAQPTAAAVVSLTGPVPDRREHADRIVRHWRTELAPLSALPAFAGRFGAPIRDVLAATVQSLLVLSLARLCEVTDVHSQVRLLAHAVLDEELPAGWRPPAGAEADAATGVIVPGTTGTESPGTESPGGAAGLVAQQGGTEVGIDGTAEERAQWVRLMRRVPTGIVRLAREMWGVRRLIDGRAEGRLWHRAVANVPAVGVVGATLGERHAATEIAARVYVALSLADNLPGI